jgi:dTDP-4-dehydrorhamnose reductase
MVTDLGGFDLKILVTASNGQLGIDVVDFYSKTCEIAAYKDVELDITDEKKVTDVVLAEKPDVIINTAAITNVDGCETTAKALAYRVNRDGAGVMARAAKLCDARLVHISTDYVFDGSAHKAYTEEDAPCPQSVYGDSKLEGEREVLKYDKSYILRTAWLFGPHGNNFVKTMLRIGAEKGEVGVVTDQVGNPTSTFELVRIIDAVLNKGDFGIYHATCSGVCSWNEFARAVFYAAGMDVKVNDLTTDQFPRPAKRPAYSDLSKEKLLKTCGYAATDWHDALKEYFDYVNSQEHQ